MINQLSYPENLFVNTYTNSTKYSVGYASVDAICELGSNSLTNKSDVRSALRLLPVSLTNFDLLGFKVNNHFFFDKCLLFRATLVVPYLKNMLSFCTGPWQKSQQDGYIIYYCDDFVLFLG